MSNFLTRSTNLDANSNLWQEMLMERCVLFERCELGALEERERRLAVGRG